MQTYKNLSSVIRQVVTEAHTKDHPPFDGPYTKSKGTVKDKSGAIHTPMSRAKELARKAMQQKMKESFDLDITDEEADDLLEHILEQDDEVARAYNPDHDIKEEKENYSAEEHREEGNQHFEDAKKHRDAGNVKEFRKTMIKHHESMLAADDKDEQEKKKGE